MRAFAPSSRPAAAPSSGWTDSVGEPADGEQRGGVAGARHRVPLVGDAAGRQQDREVGVGVLGRVDVRRRREARAPVGRREALVGVQARRARVRVDGLRGARPLHAALPAQALVRDAAHVARPAGGAGGELVEDGGRVGPRERRAVAEVAREPGDDLPVRPRLAGRRDDAAHEPDAPLGARHRALLLRPRGGRQDRVGERRGLGRVVRVLHDDELGALERGAGTLAVGQRDERVGRHDPDGLDLARLERVEQRDRRQARVRAEVVDVDAPVRGHRGAVAGVGDLAVAGQQVGEAAGLAPAHRVGLAGQRQRPAAGPADLAGREAEVDQRAVLQRADGRLVGAHRPQRHRAAGAGEAVRRLLDELRVDAADGGRALRRPLGRDRARLLPAARVAADEVRVEQAVAVDDVQHRAEQREVGAGAHRQMQVRALRGRRAARVRADDERALALAVADARPDDRVAGGGVRPEQQEAVGERDVGVRRRRAVEAERAAVAGDRRGHAQARVGVDVVRAEKALGELVDRVVVLGQQLAGDVERDRVGAVLVDDRAQAARDGARARPPSRPARSARRGRSRHSGTVARSLAWTANGRPSGLRHVRPRLAGCMRSPRTPTSRPSSTSASRPQPTPQ